MEASTIRVCVCDSGVGLDGAGEGDVEEPDDEAFEEVDEADEVNGDPAAGASKTIFFAGGSPKDDRKCFFLFLFLERRESIVSCGAPSPSLPSVDCIIATLCGDFNFVREEFEGTPVAGDMVLGATDNIEPRSCAFLRRRRRLREWVDGFPRPGGFGEQLDKIYENQYANVTDKGRRAVRWFGFSSWN